MQLFLELLYAFALSPTLASVSTQIPSFSVFLSGPNPDLHTLCSKLEKFQDKWC